MPVQSKSARVIQVKDEKSDHVFRILVGERKMMAFLPGLERKSDGTSVIPTVGGENGTQVGLGHPRIEYTWDRNGRGGWDVPVGIDAAKVFHIGKMPLKVMLEYDFYVANYSRWQPGHLVRITFLPVLPGPFHEPVFD